MKKHKTEKLNAAARLRICDRSLGLVLLLTLASGIQLEATEGRTIGRYGCISF